MENKVLKN